MPKSFIPISEDKTVTAKVGDKTTIINTGTSSVFVTDADTDQALEILEYGPKQSVLNALFALKPGETRSLKTGTYNVSITQGFGGSAVLFIEN